MENALGIPPAEVKARLKKEFNLPSRLLQVAKGIKFECTEPQLT